MTITVITLFPDMFKGPLDLSIIKRARENKYLNIEFTDLRDYATDKYRSVDDRVYGGGPGMVMRIDILDRAISAVKNKYPSAKIFLMDPQGKKFNQHMARRLVENTHLAFICGHYEGVDARIENIIDGKISIGDYILTGGELPAMVIIDALTRLIPGVLKPLSVSDETFSVAGVGESPQYTRPAEYRGWKVPPVLLSGNPKEISAWKKKQQAKV